MLDVIHSDILPFFSKLSSVYFLINLWYNLYVMENTKEALENIANKLKKGVKYEDLQSSVDELLGPLNSYDQDVDIDSEWEENYRNRTS